ncbi:crcB-like family protein [Francisella tularensis subsp. tularensis]|nr:crcB-like family protein [Francisella tularensis subsp. tularensis]
MARFALTQATASISKQIPLGILLCNIIGSLIIGMMACILDRKLSFLMKMFRHMSDFF